MFLEEEAGLLPCTKSGLFPKIYLFTGLALNC